MKTFLGFSTIVASCLVASSAFAQGSADSLYKEGRSLLDQKKYDEACPKLAESNRLEPGAGTMLALALCHEGQGKTATAHRELEQAATTAQIKGREDLAAAARKKADAMEPKLSKLVVRANPDVVLHCDGEVVKANESFAVDPGQHKVEAAKGLAARAYTVRLSGAGLTEIVVDPLDEPSASKPVAAPVVAAANTAEPPRADSTQSTGTAQRVVGLSLVAAGLAGYGVGGYFAVKGIHEQSDARKLTGQEAQDAHDRSKNNFTTAIIGAAAGTGALAAGIILFATAPSSSAPKSTARIVPTSGPGDVGMGLAGTF